MRRSLLHKAKGRNDAPGGYAGIPRHIMDLDVYKNSSGGAVKLLLEFTRQYKGSNNGDLTAAYSILKHRGFGSKGAISRALKELIDSGLIMETRPGIFLNPGGQCALYALTWKPIDECPGKRLEVGPTTTPPKQFSLEKFRKPSPQHGQGSVHKQGRPRARGEDGRFSSVHKQTRLRVVT